MNFEISEEEIENIDHRLQKYFKKEFTYFPRAIFAIIAILKHLKLSQNDHITILKTFDNDYISRCVTEPIESICKWNRKIDSNTKAIFIIHEFGFPYEQIEEISKLAKSKNIPIIEDCAWTIGTKFKNQLLGSFSDYAIFSLPKVLPMQYGAILTGIHFTDQEIEKKFSCLDPFKTKVIQKYLAHYFPKLQEHNEKRSKNWQYLENLFQQQGFKTLIKPKKDIFPGAFLLQSNFYQEWQERLEKFGIESGKYYHEKCLYLPLHQNLQAAQLDYIFGSIQGHINLQGSQQKNNRLKNDSHNHRNKSTINQNGPTNAVTAEK